MEPHGEEHAAKLLRAQTHIWNHAFSFIKVMSLKCAIDLTIPDVIHNYGQPMPLSKLTASLPIHPSKTRCIYRLMRILTHYGFFAQQNVTDEKNNNYDEAEARYALTDSSMLLLKDHPFSVTPFLESTYDPILTSPWNQFSTWLKNNEPTAFKTEHGMEFWEYASHDPKLNRIFNDAMASDSRLVSSVVVEKCKGVFEGLGSLVDVGGGTGIMAKAIAKAFPQMECIVFDLPHVVAGLQGSENLKFVGGSMFEAIPSADAVLLKCILHDWNDEQCVEILKKCKVAITASKSKEGGKVIIIDVVIMMMMENEKEEDRECVETQLCFDLEMMVLVNGKERNEREWSKLVSSAGFNGYKINPTLGYMSIIEMYP